MCPIPTPPPREAPFTPPCCSGPNSHYRSTGKPPPSAPPSYSGITDAEFRESVKKQHGFAALMTPFTAQLGALAPGSVSLIRWLALDGVPFSFSTGRMGGRDDDLPFRIELWDDKDLHVEEVIAPTSTLQAPPTRKR